MIMYMYIYVCIIVYMRACVDRVQKEGADPSAKEAAERAAPVRDTWRLGAARRLNAAGVVGGSQQPCDRDQRCKLSSMKVLRICGR